MAQSIWERLDNRITGNSSTVRMGIFSCLLSVGLFLIALSFAVSNCDVWIYRGLGIFIFVIIVIAGNWWRKHHTDEHPVRVRLKNIEENIEEIKSLLKNGEQAKDEE